ncbi:hypothetical protein QYF36_018996 [Acer negundo]|nr:hypothetical protein QYF36_018996 [Acer negundo]
MAAQHTDTGANRGFKGRKPSNLSDERGIELARKVSGVQSEFQSKCSFVDVVDGKSGHVSEVEEKAVTFHWKGHKGEGVWRRKCAIGVLKQFSSIRSANDRLEEKDFPFSSTFVRGKRVLWRFEIESECEGFIMNSFFLVDCFKSMERWSGSFTNNFRVAWVNCWGVPLSYWCLEFFTSLGRRFGDPLLIEEDTILKRQMDRR